MQWVVARFSFTFSYHFPAAKAKVPENKKCSKLSLRYCPPNQGTNTPIAPVDEKQPTENAAKSARVNNSQNEPKRWFDGEFILFNFNLFFVQRINKWILCLFTVSEEMAFVCLNLLNSTFEGFIGRCYWGRCVRVVISGGFMLFQRCDAFDFGHHGFGHTRDDAIALAALQLDFSLVSTHFSGWS